MIPTRYQGESWWYYLSVSGALGAILTCSWNMCSHVFFCLHYNFAFRFSARVRSFSFYSPLGTLPSYVLLFPRSRGKLQARHVPEWEIVREPSAHSDGPIPQAGHHHHFARSAAELLCPRNFEYSHFTTKGGDVSESCRRKNCRRILEYIYIQRYTRWFEWRLWNSVEK